MAARRREVFSFLIVAAVLIAAVLLVRSHADAIRAFIDRRPVTGVLVYLLLNVLDALVAPGATLPLIPIVVRVWGRAAAALITTAGWTAGSLAAFLIARRWGYPVVRRITSIERVKRLRRHIPQDLFWSVVALRLVMPMDVISYVLGLFSSMTWPRYIAATALGLTPSAFVLAFLGRLSHAYEIFTFGIGAAVAGWVVISMLRSRRR